MLSSEFQFLSTQQDFCYMSHSFFSDNLFALKTESFFILEIFLMGEVTFLLSAITAPIGIVS